VFFPDPKVAVATLIEQDGKVLLVQRAHNPFRGKWMLPAGFVDAGEDPQEAAVREVEEETSLQVDITQLRDVFANRAYEGGADIIIVYQGEVISGELKAGDDAAQAIFFSRDHLPALAFESTKRILFM
jgi:ADP-ribose pyrophosphatase YjhB (NUDIX family)